MSDDTAKTPDWLLQLENRKKRHGRLAHEIGAGAPCLSCGDKCPGLDLHFWRKLCRNCKCKKEEHDVKDDEGYEQFEILLGPGSKRKKRSAYLKMTVQETEKDERKNVKSKEVAFDWVPPNVTDDVAVEYMKQLPTAKLPISGSDGALYRRQQLERQVPLHDLDASCCDNLTPQEVEGLKKYLENLKSHVVGQGRVTKVPVLHAEVRWLAGDQQGKALPTSYSADSIRGMPLPSFSVPRPFLPAASQTSGENDDDFPPPPLPDTSPPNLKMPSNFVPSWKPFQVPGQQIVHSEAVPGETFVALPLPSTSTLDDGRLLRKHMDTSGANSSDVSSKIKANNFDIQKNAGRSTSLGLQDDKNSPNEMISALPVEGVISSHIQPTKTISSETPQNIIAPGMSLPYTHGGKGFGNINKVVGGEPQHGAIIGSKYPSGEISYSEPQPGHLGDMKYLNKQGVYGAELPNNLAQSMPSAHLSRDQEISKVPLNEMKLLPSTSNDTLKSSNSTFQDSALRNLKYPTTDISHSLPVAGQKFSPPYSKSKPLSVGSGNNIDVYRKGTGADNDNSTDHIGHSDSTNDQGIVASRKDKDNNSVSFGTHNIQHPEGMGKINVGHPSFGTAEPFAADMTMYSTMGPHGEVAYSEGVPTDALPKSALAMQQQKHDTSLLDPEITELAGRLEQMKNDNDSGILQPQFSCRECNGPVLAGDVAVFADRAGQDVAWHPSCFVCSTCKELLVDLIYFFSKGNVYCGRHYADLLKIPRCFACDELIFVNEYTMAEGQAFHVKHFCCYECDVPLGGMKYVPVDGQPVCLDCFQEKYGKSCHACKRKIGASEQRVSWKELHWHVSGNCFTCFTCRKSLLGGRFVVKQNQPFCSKECFLAADVS